MPVLCRVASVSYGTSKVEKRLPWLGEPTIVLKALSDRFRPLAEHCPDSREGSVGLLFKQGKVIFQRVEYVAHDAGRTAAEPLLFGLRFLLAVRRVLPQ